MDKIKKSVRYKILIKFNNIYHKVGTIVIRTYTGDLMYVPSDSFIESPITLEKKEIEHITWHVSGQVHVKKKGQTEIYDIIQKSGDRQKLTDAGFQNMINDFVNDFTKLQPYNKKVIPLDVVFDLDNNPGQVCFNFSIVSGKLIVAQYRGIETPLVRTNIAKENDGLAVKRRALGWHSGHGDIMLQYSLRKSSNEDIRTNRRIFIPHDMKISKIEYDKLLK